MTYRSIVNAMRALNVNPDEVAAGRSITGGERFKQVGGTYYVREASDEERDLIIEMMDDAIDRRGKPHLTPKDKRDLESGEAPVMLSEEHINLERIFGPDATDEEQGIRDFMAAIGDVYGHFLDRVDKVTTEDMVKGASALGLKRATLRLMKGKEEIPFKNLASQILAMRLAQLNWVKATKDSIAKAREAQRLSDADPSDAALKADAEKWNGISKKAISQSALLYQNLGDIKTEWGRAGVAMRYVADIDEKVVGDLMTVLERSDTQTMDDFYDSYLRLGLGDQNTFLQEVASRGELTGNIVKEIFINAILTSPITHMVNVTSNFINGIWSVPERMVASGFGAARTRIRRGKTAQERVRFSEAAAFAFGNMRAIGEGFRAGARAYMSEMPTDEVSKLEYRHGKAVTGANVSRLIPGMGDGGVAAQAMDFIGKWIIRQAGRALLFEDEFFKAMMRSGERNALMVRRALELQEQGMDGDLASIRAVEEVVNAPSPQTSMRVEEAALRGTFQGELDGFLAHGQRLFSHPLMKFYLPFYRTPTNILKALVDRTPLPLLDHIIVGKSIGGGRGALERLGLSDYGKAIKKGGPDSDMANGRMALGAMTLGSLSMMMEMSPDIVFTGGMPTDPRVRQAWQRRGMQEYSINFRQTDGSWTSISFNRFEPLSGLLGMVSDYNQYAAYEPDSHTLEQMTMAMTAGLYNYMTSLPMLEYIGEFSDAMMHGERSVKGVGDRLVAIMEQPLKGGMTVAQSMLSLGFMPASLSSLAARATDPTLRSTLPWESTTHDSVAMVHKVLKETMAGIPGLSHGMKPRLNRWGEEVVRPGGWMSNFTPIRVRDVTSASANAVDSEFVKLGIGVSMPKKSHFGVKLSDDQYSKLIRYANDPSLAEHYKGSGDETGLVEILYDVMQSDSYLAAEDNDERQRYFQDLVTKRDAIAMELLYLEEPELKAQIDEAKAAAAKGGMGMGM